MHRWINFASLHDNEHVDMLLSEKSNFCCTLENRTGYFQTVAPSCNNKWSGTVTPAECPYQQIFSDKGFLAERAAGTERVQPLALIIL